MTADLAERYGPNWADVAAIVTQAHHTRITDLHHLARGGREAETLDTAARKHGLVWEVRNATDDVWMASAHLMGLPCADQARSALCDAAAAHVLRDVLKPLAFRNATLAYTRAYPEQVAA